MPRMVFSDRTCSVIPSVKKHVAIVHDDTRRKNRKPTGLDFISGKILRPCRPRAKQQQAQNSDSFHTDFLPFLRLPASSAYKTTDIRTFIPNSSVFCSPLPLKSAKNAVTPSSAMGFFSSISFYNQPLSKLFRFFEIRGLTKLLQSSIMQSNQTQTV